MLHHFLLAERERILALCATKVLNVGENRTSNPEMKAGLPIFYDELVEVLRADAEGSTLPDDQVSESIHSTAAKRRGKESLRLGYTVSQVVHGYGALCQAITEYAAEHSGEPIEAREFNRLNFCLDVAIADAVTEFNHGLRDTAAQEEVQRLGFLAHEMRNALANASTAHQMIKKGLAGLGGSTNGILERALTRMTELIDRALSEVRLRGEPTLDRQRCQVVGMIGEVEATAQFEADAKSCRLHVECSPELFVLADRHLVVSAISNLVQNAIKFTREGGNIWIRGHSRDGRVLIEVQDECGGLPPGKIEALFQPFTQKNADKSGVGLGLSICRRAIDLNDGSTSARDIPGSGCVFTIDLALLPPGQNE